MLTRVPMRRPASAGDLHDALLFLVSNECRHTYVTLMCAAGNSLEVVGDLVGHSSVYMTDRYRHLLDGAERDAARKLDEYLARADTRSRVEQLG
jgi:hypothetical protein